MSPFTRMRSRLLSSLVAAALFAAPFQVAVAAPSIEELYGEGQAKFDAGEFGEAGDLWGQAVQLNPEDKNNSSMRTTLTGMALEAYLRAYSETDSREQLEAAKALGDAYETSLEGSGTEVSDVITDFRGTIEEKLATLDEAEAAAAAAAAAAASEETDKPEETGPTSEDPLPPGDPKPGMPLVITGGVLLGVGGVGIGLLIGGALGSITAQADFDDPANADDLDQIERQGKTMNALAIAGAVVAPVFLAAGAALLIVGIKKNKRARQGNFSLTPVLSPRFSGLSVSGRF